MDVLSPQYGGSGEWAWWFVTGQASMPSDAYYGGVGPERKIEVEVVGGN